MSQDLIVIFSIYLYIMIVPAVLYRTDSAIRRASHLNCN